MLGDGEVMNNGVCGCVSGAGSCEVDWENVKAAETGRSLCILYGRLGAS